MSSTGEAEIPMGDDEFGGAAPTTGSTIIPLPPRGLVEGLVFFDCIAIALWLISLSTNGSWWVDPFVYASTGCYAVASFLACAIPHQPADSVFRGNVFVVRIVHFMTVVLYAVAIFLAVMTMRRDKGGERNALSVAAILVLLLSAIMVLVSLCASAVLLDNVDRWKRRGPSTRTRKVLQMGPTPVDDVETNNSDSEGGGGDGDSGSKRRRTKDRTLSDTLRSDGEHIDRADRGNNPAFNDDTRAWAVFGNRYDPLTTVKDRVIGTLIIMFQLVSYAIMMADVAEEASRGVIPVEVKYGECQNGTPEILECKTDRRQKRGLFVSMAMICFFLAGEFRDAFRALRKTFRDGGWRSLPFFLALLALLEVVTAYVTSVCAATQMLYIGQTAEAINTSVSLLFIHEVGGRVYVALKGKEGTHYRTFFLICLPLFVVGVAFGGITVFSKRLV